MIKKKVPIPVLLDVDKFKTPEKIKKTIIMQIIIIMMSAYISIPLWLIAKSLSDLNKKK